MLSFPLVNYGRPQTENLEDAVAHAQSGQPVACPTARQVRAMWQHRALAHRLPFLRLL